MVACYKIAMTNPIKGWMDGFIIRGLVVTFVFANCKRCLRRSQIAVQIPLESPVMYITVYL